MKIKINETENKFVRQVGYTVFAQGMSLAQSTIMSFVVAKVLDVGIFAWWQWFLFLAGLTHYIHVGIGEGIYIRYGGMNYNDLNRDLVGSEVKIYAMIQVFVSTAIIAFGYIRYGYSNELFCLAMAAFFMILANLSYVLAQLLISCSRISDYAKAVIINKSIIFIGSIALIVFCYRDYQLFVVLYCIGQFVEFISCIYLSKTLLVGKLCGIRTVFKEFLVNIKVGFILALSTFAANMVTNVGRYCVKLTWGLASFGVLSMANSLTSFFLMFIRQVGVVLFPFLRRMEGSQQKKLFNTLNEGIDFLAFFLMLFYYPARFILQLWLPQYAESLIYLGLMLPIVVLDSQMSVLYTPYLTALRKERTLLILNLVSFAVTLISTLGGMYFIGKMEAVALCVPLGMAVKSFGGFIVLSNFYENTKSEWIRQIVLDMIIIIVFLFSVYLYNVLGYVLYAIAFLFYAFLKREIITKIYLKLSQR